MEVYNNLWIFHINFGWAHTLQILSVQLGLIGGHVKLESTSFYFKPTELTPQDAFHSPSHHFLKKDKN